jgi:hypothetical protein
MSTTYTYYRENGQHMQAFARSASPEQAAENIRRSIPDRLRPDTDELLALRNGQSLVLPEGRQVERTES